MRGDRSTNGGGPMRAAFPARRRAEDFDALLDGTFEGSPSPELAELVDVVASVRSVPEVAPRAEFAADLRERLMAAAPDAMAAGAADTSSDTAARLTVGRRTPGRTRRSRERRIGVAIAAFSLVGATTASAVASQGALPGDTLYPVKRLIEDARTTLAMGEDAKADVLLAQARTRLTEVRELSARPGADPTDIEQALQDFGDTAHHASTLVLADYADHGDRRSVDQLRTFTQEGVTTLGQLTGVLPPSVDGVLADVANTLIQIDQSAAQACPACTTGGVTELPSSLIQLLSAVTGDGTSPTAAVTPPTTTSRPARPRHATPSSGASTAPGIPVSGQPSQPSTNAGGGRSTAPAPSSAPTSVGGAVGGAGGAVGGAVTGVGGAVGDLGGQVGGPAGGVVGGVGGVVGGVGGTVGGLTGTVGGTVDGVVGGLLGTPTPSPGSTPKP